MKKSTKNIAVGLSGLLVAGAITAASAERSNKGDDYDDSSTTLVNEASIDVEQAISIALADVPGKVLEAEFEHENGTAVWEIEVLDELNQVFELEIDANSGEILENEQDDD